jgi:hypothetical protein
MLTFSVTFPHFLRGGDAQRDNKSDESVGVSAGAPFLFGASSPSFRYWSSIRSAPRRRMREK